MLQYYLYTKKSGIAQGQRSFWERSFSPSFGGGREDVSFCADNSLIFKHLHTHPPTI